MTREANTKQPEPRPDKHAIWSIGIYTGDTPFDLMPAIEAENPVICSHHVTDIQAEFVADPFMIKAGESWHMFFEVMNAQTKRGEIGLATSEDGLSWHYRRIVLREPFHLSYPYVFRVGAEYYLMPETAKANSVRLYRADLFPYNWSLVGTIVEGARLDPSAAFFDGLWWLFTSRVTGKNDTLDLFYAEALGGPWKAHPMNPIIDGNGQIARPAGRLLVDEGRMFRFTQDCSLWYGTQVRAFEIIELTKSTYSEQEVDQSPVLRAGEHTWHQWGMHHVDPHRVNGRWIACVDGWRPGKVCEPDIS